MHLHRAILRTGTTLLEKKQIRHLRAFRMAVVKEGPDVQLFTHPAALTKLALWLGQAIAEQERDRKGGMMMGMKRGGRGTPLVVAGLNERRGVYVVVGTGRGSGAAMMPDPTKKEKGKKREDAITKAAEKEKRHTEKDARKAERRQRRREQQGDDSNDDESNSSTASTSSEDGDDDDDDNGDDANEADDNEENEKTHRVRRRRGYGLNRFGHAFQEVVDETNARVRIDSFEHCVVEVRVDDLATFLESLSLKVVVG